MSPRKFRRTNRREGIIHDHIVEPGRWLTCCVLLGSLVGFIGGILDYVSGHRLAEAIMSGAAAFAATMTRTSSCSPSTKRPARPGEPDDALATMAVQKPIRRVIPAYACPPHVRNGAATLHERPAAMDPAHPPTLALLLGLADPGAARSATTAQWRRYAERLRDSPRRGRRSPAWSARPNGRGGGRVGTDAT